LEDASCEAACPLAVVALAENHTATMARRLGGAEAKAEIMRRPEAEVAKERANADEGTQGRGGWRESGT